MFPRLFVAICIISILGFAETRGQSQQPARYQSYEPARPVSLEAAPAETPLLEFSLGFNYIYLGNQYPETKNLYGVDVSAFLNATSWLALGADFMANFGTHSVPYLFGSNIDVDSQRYIYVFGPRVTVWRNSQFRIFAEALAGGVHAEADFSVSNRFFSSTATATDNGFATALGGGFDWRLTDRWSWRVLQADYLGTGLGKDWQNNFRASTGIVYEFGGR